MAKPQKSTDTVRTKKAKDSKHAVVTTSKSKKKAPTLADGADRYALYRLSVPDPEHEVNMFERFYKDAFGKRPTTLREDFCAAAAVCCEWVQRSGERRAWGVANRANPPKTPSLGRACACAQCLAVAGGRGRHAPVVVGGACPDLCVCARALEAGTRLVRKQRKESMPRQSAGGTARARMRMCTAARVRK